jgi:hypothetical protein
MLREGKPHKERNRMAEQIPQLSVVQGGRPSKYAWSEWMDGSAWRLVQGEDFDTSVKVMASHIRNHAVRTNRSVSVRTFPGVVELQFNSLDKQAA